jgi:hypothetical protein
MPLRKEAPLAKAPEIDARRVLAARARQRRGVAPDQRRRPFGPGPLVEGVGQRHEQRIVVEPFGLADAKTFEQRPVIGTGVTGKPAGGRRQLAHPPGHDRGEVDTRSIRGRIGHERAGGQPSAPLQFGQIDQQDVAGKGGTAHVGRIAGADPAQRQDLPPALTGAHQPVDEVIRTGAQVAAAVRSGQRSGMEQHATHTVGTHQPISPAAKAGHPATAPSTSSSRDCAGRRSETPDRESDGTLAGESQAGAFAAVTAEAVA